MLRVNCQEEKEQVLLLTGNYISSLFSAKRIAECLVSGIAHPVLAL